MMGCQLARPSFYFKNKCPARLSGAGISGPAGYCSTGRPPPCAQHRNANERAAGISFSRVPHCNGSRQHEDYQRQKKKKKNKDPPTTTTESSRLAALIIAFSEVSEHRRQKHSRYSPKTGRALGLGQVTAKMSLSKCKASEILFPLPTRTQRAGRELVNVVMADDGWLRRSGCLQW